MTLCFALCSACLERGIWDSAPGVTITITVETSVKVGVIYFNFGYETAAESALNQT